MTVLTIDEAKYPDGCSATPASGGSLATSTQYYYRVAAVTVTGETCACEAFSGTTDNSNKKLNLAWNAVPGVKASGGYRIYRNTSDSWAAGNHFLIAVNTNSYVDDGGASLAAGLPMTFTCDKVTTMPLNEQSLVDQKNIAGKEGGSVGYLGSPPSRLHLEGLIKGASAKTELDKLRSIRAGGVACEYTLAAYSVTWVQEDYLLESIQWSPDSGMVDDADAIVLRFLLDLVKIV